MKATVLCLSVIGAIAAVGCAQSKVYAPAPAAIRVQLRGLPVNLIAVEVTDLRAERPADDSLSAILREQLISSLGEADSSQSLARHRLLLDIIEHRSYFTLGNWHGSTHLRARLVAPGGQVSGPWEATGSAHRSNMFGYQTAKAVSQESYNAAIADLLSALNAISIR